MEHEIGSQCALDYENLLGYVKQRWMSCRKCLRISFANLVPMKQPGFLPFCSYSKWLLVSLETRPNLCPFDKFRDIADNFKIIISALIDKLL